MSEIDRYVEGNILLFTDQLRWETSPALQETLKRLLIREEDRLGRREERLELAEERLRLAERLLRDGADLIARQTRRIADMKSDGADTGGAERRLREFQSIQSLFEQFRAAIA